MGGGYFSPEITIRLSALENTSHSIVDLENQRVNFNDFFNESINKNLDFIVPASEPPQYTKLVFNYDFNDIGSQLGGSMILGFLS